MPQNFYDLQEESRWEDNVMRKEQGLFLQSYAQKKLFESLGQKTWLFESVDKSVSSLITKVVAKRGTFLFLPYGPLIADPEKNFEKLQAFFEFLKELGKKEKASFLRISPFWEDIPEKRKALRALHFRPSPLHMLAETLWLSNLEGKNEEQIMMGMEKKHRNLIRRAMKDGVIIEKAADSSAIERFISLHQQTVDRHGFTPYPVQYFRKQVELFAPKNEVLIFEAWYQGKLLASAIIMFYGSSAAYHHGASTSDLELRKIPASYLLQWEAIREAMNRGMKTYNFWGIAPDSQKNHPFSGITHFKTGFGGYRSDLMPCHDLILSPRYVFNWGVEMVRKWKRGF